MASKNIPGKPQDPKRLQLDSVLIQLTSQRPSDVWRGMEQVRQWLKEDMEDREVYGLLLDAVEKNRDLREQVRGLLLEMMQKGSKVAEQAILSLPSSVPDIMADANDAYYAAEFDKAIQLYRQVLRLDPENSAAKDHLAKAILKRGTGDSPTDLPRAAQQYYRRARSFIAIRDVVTSMNLLNAAVEAAQAKGMKYPEAEEALNNIQNLVLADEQIGLAKAALEKGKHREAITYYENALKLDPTNPELPKKIRKERLTLNSWWGIPLLIVIVAFSIYGYAAQNPGQLKPTPTITNTEIRNVVPSSTVAIKLSQTSVNLTQTATNTEIISASETSAITASPSFTKTSIPTSTEEILGVAFINKAIASVWQEPNKGLQGQLRLYQPLILLEEKLISNSTWYRCRWELDGNTQEGWILADNITFGPPPIPSPNS
jgi:tetratricopeptide (TPR) repeat protein